MYVASGSVGTSSAKGKIERPFLTATSTITSVAASCHAAASRDTCTCEAKASTADTAFDYSCRNGANRSGRRD